MFTRNSQHNQQQLSTNNTPSMPSLHAISNDFESLKCVPVQQEMLFNGTLVQYYQCSNNNNRVNLDVKVEITQDTTPSRHFRWTCLFNLSMTCITVYFHWIGILKRRRGYFWQWEKTDYGNRFSIQPIRSCNSPTKIPFSSYRDIEYSFQQTFEK